MQEDASVFESNAHVHVPLAAPIDYSPPPKYWGPKLQNTPLDGLRGAPLSALLEHPFVDGVFRSLLGDDYVYLGSDGKLHGVGGTRQAQCHPANVSVSPSP